MTDDAPIRKVNAYTLNDVKGLSLLLITQNEKQTAYNLNDFANECTVDVIRTVAAHTSSDADCMACVLKVAWALAMEMLVNLEEDGIADELMDAARALVRGLDESREQ